MDISNRKSIEYKRQGLSIKSENAYRLLFALIWTQYTVISFVTVVLQRLPFLSLIADYVYPTMIIIALFFSLSWIMKHIRLNDLLFYFTCVLLLILSMLFYKANANYIKKDLFAIVCISFPMLFIGLSYNNKRQQKDLFYLSIIGVLTMFIYQLYYLSSGRLLSTDNMYASYNVLPSILYLIYWAVMNKKVRYWIYAFLGIFLSFLFGTRGAVLSMLVFAISAIFISNIRSKNKWEKIVFFAVSIYGIVIISVKDSINNIIEYLAIYFNKWGFSTRIFDYYLSGDLSYASGRDIITDKILDAIRARPVFGYGIMGDRVVLNAGQGDYAHNIFTELWCQFGVVIGSIILLFLFIIIIRAILNSKTTGNKLFIIMIASMVLIKLMFSGSYLIEPYMFFLIGICISAIRTNRITDRGVAKR